MNGAAWIFRRLLRRPGRHCPARIPGATPSARRPFRAAAAAALLLVLAALVPAPAPAQQTPPVSLIADSVQIESGNRIAARGNVEILAGDIRLSAAAVLYDGSSGKLRIEGPIILSQGAGSVVLASSAELDSELRNGIIRSARLVLNRQLQLAAAELSRADGRFSRLSRAVASSCRVCAGRQPLWEIRAAQIVHDQQKRQLYFDRAQLRVAGIPVFYLPRLRMPDPTVSRATGFLVPDIRTTSRLGSGIRLPYFIALGDHADLTLTPYLSPVTTTLQARYRQAFHRGRLQFDAALTRDRLLPGETRAYLFGRSNLALAGGFRLGYDLELTTDPGYLLEYGFSGKDRLDSEIRLERTRGAESFSARLTHLQTLRASELPIAGLLPEVQAGLRYERRFAPPLLGGRGLWELSADAHVRPSGADGAGRDMIRSGARLEWNRSMLFGPGLALRLGAGFRADSYRIAQDSAYPQNLLRFTGAVEGELRWPWVRAMPDGGTAVLEPVAQLAFGRSVGALPPNEDSTLVEFDEGNLFALSRFPGEDRVEQGLRGALGLRWSRQGPWRRGWSFALGRVLRESDPGQFSRASGLDGLRSDWLGTARIRLGDRFALTSRALFDDRLSLTKGDAVLDWQGPRLALSATYSHVIPDPSETRPDPTTQLTLDASYRLPGNWRASLQYRRDLAAARTTRAALGLRYVSECIRVDLSLSRRFTTSVNVAPTTDLGLSVSLFGFGPERGAAPRSCSGT